MVTMTNLPNESPSDRWVRRVLLVVLFAAAFGYLEAAVVVYLRTVYDPIHEAVYPDRPPGSLLPLVTVQQLAKQDPSHAHRLIIELGREVAAMVMLLAVALLAARRPGEWLAMFMVSFGVWDITFYLGLKAMINFPASLLTWDILFLVPVPWLGPVLATLIVSVTMMAAGLVVLAQTARGHVLTASWYHWAGVVLGGLIIIVSFCQDYSRTMAGELPERFNWVLFAAGEIVGLAAFVHVLLRDRRAGGSLSRVT